MVCAPIDGVDTGLTLSFRAHNRRLFRATSVKCSPHAVTAVQRVFDEESASLRQVTNGSVTVTYQYLSQSFVDAAHTAGNAIDLDPGNGPLIGILPRFRPLHG